MIHFRFSGAIFAGTATALAAFPAFALDGKDMMDKLVSAYAAYGPQITYDAADTDGSSVVAKGVKVKFTDPKQDVVVPVGDVRFDDVKEGDSGYDVGTTSFQNVDLTNEGVHLTTSDIKIDGLHIPAKAGGDKLDGLLLYKAVHSGPIVAEKDGKKVFSVDSINANLDLADDQSSMKFDAQVANVYADLTGATDEKSKEAIEKLGLQTISGQVTMKGSWEVATGKFDVPEYAFDIKDVGKLNISFSISGYTMAFIKSLQDTMKATAANPDKKAAEQAAGLAMLGLMQQLTFNSMAIRFDDASITKKVLDYVGAQQNVSGEQLAQSLKGMVPILLGQLNMPEFQSQVSAAVNSYLDNPKNIEVKAAPANPVGVPMIVGAAMGDPKTLINVLGVTVTANQ